MKIVTQNRRARYDYAITDTLEAGIVLTGQEVKSCRQGHVHLSGSYVSFRGGVPLLKNATITPYSFASDLQDYDPARDRVLLMKKTDIERFQSATDEKGVTVLPLEVRAGRRVKVLLGLGRGMKKRDKRAKIRERDIERKLKYGEEV